MSTFEPGSEMPTHTIEPDGDVTYRYAGASGDFNPIHLDDDFARSVGLPGRILHGLWTMAQLARAHTDSAGGPASLRELSCQFRGFGVPEAPLQIRRTVRSSEGKEAVVDGVIEQQGTLILRNSTARLSLPEE